MGKPWAFNAVFRETPGAFSEQEIAAANLRHDRQMGTREHRKLLPFYYPEPPGFDKDSPGASQVLWDWYEQIREAKGLTVG